MMVFKREGSGLCVCVEESAGVSECGGHVTA